MNDATLVEQRSAIALNEVDIALGVDRAYAAHAAAVISSVVAHAPGAQLRFLILHSGVERALQMTVEHAAPGAKFAWREIGDADVPAMAQREHFSRAILFRLGIERHAPADWRRVLYLDADVIVNRDVRELWREDLGEAPIGAVIDCYVDAPEFAERWSLAREGSAYFNSGVLLIDLEHVRAERLFTRAIEFCAEHLDEIYLADQDALNAVAWGRWARLPNAWNVQRHMVIPSLIAQTPVDRQLGAEAPAIIHFTGPEKPWTMGYHPWSWLYWRALKRTAFVRDVSKRYRMGPVKRLMLWQRWLKRKF